MNEQDQRRFDMLCAGQIVNPDYLFQFYGISWPLSDDLQPDYRQWVSQLSRPTECNENVISRFELEGFMQQKSVIPKKWMGARLGMDVASFEKLLGGLEDIGMRSQRYVVYDDLIAESLSEDIVPNLPGLRFRTFSDHNSFCERLHADIYEVLKFKVEGLFCATADRIEDYPKQFANNFDCITSEPLSGKHQIWLDFRKPLNLAPDRCSKLLYVENRVELQPHCAGKQEPDDLQLYTEFLTREQHA